MNRVQPSYSLTSTMWHFGELEASKSTDGVKRRVIPCYRQPSPHKSDPDGTLDMVLHDEHVNVIGRVVSYEKPTFVPKLETRRMDFKKEK
ncbi:hypothetical protein CASFOL_031901 [Castilleja foliolosa]|uniref:Uncharacterized protein n=1 Tax=Castilleja foliolosa TaxID=1961234 RepID=A0ABD3BZY5_9LAMI